MNLSDVPQAITIRALECDSCAVALVLYDRAGLPIVSAHLPLASMHALIADMRDAAAVYEAMQRPPA
ncbi:MAG TPA: hypothetical protein VFA12_20500 [Stellaceae bacterium]|nr:hypothetical protein [Stellaceae bacterium]